MDAGEEGLSSSDAWTRAMTATDVITELQERVAEVSQIRREAIDDLLSQGNRQTEIADRLGLTRARLSKLLSSGPQPARALLGTGALTVAIGGKAESAQTQKTSPRAVISAEAMAAYHLIQNLAGEYSLNSEYELVPPPGMVRLNRSNLIVMTSPRLLPLVGQVLEADPYLAFESGARGWHLTDRTTGEEFRSPSDTGDAADYGYIGRLPRPDGKGTFLYLAGIHAMGTLGAARFLTDNIEQLYGEVRNRKWSTIIECRYDADSREIESVSRVAPVHKF